MNTRNKEIIELAKIIGRSPGAVAMKLVNFASLDPAIVNTGRHGLGNLSIADKQVWDEFHNNWEKLTIECGELLERYNTDKMPVDEATKGIEITNNFEDESKTTIVNARIGQSYFRKVVLACYHNKCCMCGIAIPGILVASHIVPWGVAKENRLNPSNGLCLSAIHDKAFDKGFMTITPEYTIRVSKVINDDNSKQALLLQKLHSKKITLPEKFLPNRDFLSWHYQNVFIGE